MQTLTNLFLEHTEWFLLISLLTIVGTLILVPAIIIRIPTRYFCHNHRHTPDTRHWLLRYFLVIAKNLLGFILVLAGIIMLFTPGQGLLTLLVGMIIMNYPGKYTLERWLISRPNVLPAINWLRKRYNRAPLISPDASETWENE